MKMKQTGLGQRAVAHVAAGSRPGSGPGPSVAAARCAAAISGPGPDPGPDPAATCATARWPLPVYLIFRSQEEK